MFKQLFFKQECLNFDQILLQRKFGDDCRRAYDLHREFRRQLPIAVVNEKGCIAYMKILCLYLKLNK